MVTTVNHTVLYTWNLLRGYILNVLTTKKKIVTRWGNGYVNWLNCCDHVTVYTSKPICAP